MGTVPMSTDPIEPEDSYEFDIADEAFWGDVMDAYVNVRYGLVALRPA